MISEDPTAFPNCVVPLLVTALLTVDSETDPDQRISIYRRPLRTTDNVQSIGIFPTDWRPDRQSHEMRGTPLGGGVMGEDFPTLTDYNITIQSLVQDPEEERGINVHAALSTRIRATVARNETLRLALRQLSSVVLGHAEAFRRSEVRSQRYLAMELQGTWLYMSVTEFWFQTQSN